MEIGSNKTNKRGELFSSLISNIKDYNGDDPLRPWIQGIRKMKETLPTHILKEKLPRFLQNCAQTFESDPQYQNDSRYVRVWIQLMDYVDDAKVVLRKLEKNHIGLKRAIFYSAYALYYEKQKKFEKAKNMYRLGVQNLAEPAEELHESHEQFLHRMKLLKERRTNKRMLISSRSNRMPPPSGKSAVAENGRFEKDEASQISHSTIKSKDQQVSAKHMNSIRDSSEEGRCKSTTSSLDTKLNTTANQNEASYKLEERGNPAADDTVVVKFVGSAIVGKSEAEYACHHGLVDPTVNMKEAMNAIGSMFTEPLELEPMVRRRSQQSKLKESRHANALEVFVDGSPTSPKKQTQNEPEKPFVGGFKIWTEEDDNDEDDDENYSDEEPKPISNSTGTNKNSCEDIRLKDDTVIRRFMGSTAFDGPRVENAWHHGLVDPTVNLKEAMDDINDMFGEPLNFVRAKRSRNQEIPMQRKSAASEGFSILADDDLEEDRDINGMLGEPLNFVGAKRPRKQEKPTQQKPAVSQGFSVLADDDLEEDSKCHSSKSNSDAAEDSSLFEPTVFTREAMAEINDMFGKPLDF